MDALRGLQQNHCHRCSPRRRTARRRKSRHLLLYTSFVLLWTTTTTRGVVAQEEVEETIFRRIQRDDSENDDDAWVNVFVGWVSEEEASTRTASSPSEATTTTVSLSTSEARKPTSLNTTTTTTMTSTTTHAAAASSVLSSTTGWSWDHIGKAIPLERSQHAVAVTVKKSSLTSLDEDPRVAYWDYNNIVYPMTTTSNNNIQNDKTAWVPPDPSKIVLLPSNNDNNNDTGEQVPWGITAIGADTDFPLAADAQGGTTDCFKICVVDGGTLLEHPDIPFTSANAWGKTFGLPPDQSWDRPLFNHGTHVAGILLAEAGNDIGIQGVIPNPKNICLLTARVFGDTGTGALDSDIFSAVNWCADEGARVINLSLGSPGSGTRTARDIYERIHADGALVVSASGNSYDTKYNYPASFDQVISVSAVDVENQRASFSTYNDQVNVAAPGVSIRSTVPKSGVTDGMGRNWDVTSLEFARVPMAPVAGEWVDCAQAKSDFDCPNASGKICLIERGIVSFADKARLCQVNGGIAAIIYNNGAGAFAGTLGNEGSVSIPVVGMLRVDGLALRTSSGSNRRVTLSFLEPGYTEISGTSMATPFVAGVAARIWSIRPQCTNDQVKEAIYMSARSLGTQDSDRVFFGLGLVQAQAAYQALLEMPAPCGFQESESSMTLAPSSWWDSAPRWTSPTWTINGASWQTKSRTKKSGGARYLRRRSQESSTNMYEPRTIVTQ